jgi:hypothetical protein
LLSLGTVFGACTVSVIAFGGTIVTDRIGITDFYPSPPRLPAYAYPIDAEKLDESTYCGGNKEEWFPSCRRLEFGSDLVWEESERQLSVELTRRGWTVTRFGSGGLDAEDKAQRVCVVYYAREPNRAPAFPNEHTRRRAGFVTLIEAFVDDCSTDD